MKIIAFLWGPSVKEASRRKITKFIPIITQLHNYTTNGFKLEINCVMRYVNAIRLKSMMTFLGDNEKLVNYFSILVDAFQKLFIEPSDDFFIQTPRACWFIGSSRRENVDSTESSQVSRLFHRLPRALKFPWHSASGAISAESSRREVS